MHALAEIVVYVNALANLMGRTLLAPIGVLPGWLSVTLIAVVTGVLMLIAFKYTSNQTALKHVRDGIKADLLALKLFKESASVALQAQGRIVGGAFKLLLLSLVPMLVMFVPVGLLLVQLGLWYQARPLQVGEEAVITLKLTDSTSSACPGVRLAPSDAVKVLVGPLRVFKTGEICWNVRALQPGYHRLVFQTGESQTEKELAVGAGLMRVSTRRPGEEWLDRFSHPSEEPYGPSSPIESIEIDYPERSSWISGTNWWMVYWFAVSMVAAFALRRVLKVNI